MLKIYRDYISNVVTTLSPREMLLNFTTDVYCIQMTAVEPNTRTKTSLIVTPQVVNITYINADMSLNQSHDMGELKVLDKVLEPVRELMKLDSTFSTSSRLRGGKFVTEQGGTVTSFINNLLVAIDNIDNSRKEKARFKFVTHLGLTFHYAPDRLKVDIVLHLRDRRTNSNSIEEHSILLMDNKVVLPNNTSYPVVEGCKEYEKLVLN